MSKNVNAEDGYAMVLLPLGLGVVAARSGGVTGGSVKENESLVYHKVK